MKKKKLNAILFSLVLIVCIFLVDCGQCNAEAESISSVFTDSVITYPMFGNAIDFQYINVDIKLETENPTTITEAVIEVSVEEPAKPYDDKTVEVLTNLLYGEARGVKDKAHQAAVIWCVLNRYDTGKYGATIIDVATAKNQFCGYVEGRIYEDEKSYDNCKNIVIDVLSRYYSEAQEGRVLPKEYLYFVADESGLDNVFTNKWKSTNYWDWSLESPYK